MKAYKDMTGLRFGRLVVIEIAEKATHGKCLKWRCKCDCGNDFIAYGARLRSGTTQSCGCLQRELSSQRLSERMTTHGNSKTRLYKIWSCMKNRCTNSNYTHYNCYGGRGIKVCAEWENSFELFHEWAIHSGYSDELTLDRTDVNGDYTPSNCRWISMKLQGNNRRNNHWLTYKGETLTLTQMAEKYGIAPYALSGRLNIGWSIEKAIETPVRKRKAPTKYEDNAEA